MKKRNVFFYSALALGMVGTLASCSSDDDIVAGVPGGSLGNAAGSDQVIEIALENGSNELTTRGGRPLTSEAPAQDIDYVKVLITDKSGKIVADTLFANWMSSSAVADYDDASGHGRKARFTLTGSNANRVTNGADAPYTVYAIGYSDDTQYTVESEGLKDYMNKKGNGFEYDSSLKGEDLAANAKSTTETETGGADLNNLVLKNGNNRNAEEIFAGSAQINFNGNGDNAFTLGLTLHRQVAGIFTYVKNIPYIYTTSDNGQTVTPATTLHLYASANNGDLVLGQFYNAIATENGTNNVAMNVVNGGNPYATTEVVDGKNLIELYSIDLNQWFDNTIQDANNDGAIDYCVYTYNEANKTYDAGSTFWEAPNLGNGWDDVSFAPGSVFGSSFLIPFKAVDKTQTFFLTLEYADGTFARGWNINLPNEDKVASSAALPFYEWDSSKFTSNTNYKEEDVHYYSVLRNHLYGVGKKTADGYTPGTDDPIDLNTNQDIVLQVNDNWQLIHRMDVESPQP